MTTWGQIRGWLRERFALLRDEDGWCGWGVTLPGGALPVVAKRSGSDARPEVLLAARVSDRGAIDPVDALRYNATAEVGALVLEDEAYLLRLLIPVAALDAAELGAIVGRLIAEAARIRPPQRATVAANLSHWVE